MPNHLGHEEIGNSCGAETAAMRVPQVVKNEISKPGVLKCLGPSSAQVL
jgi:hypothetical protein